MTTHGIVGNLAGYNCAQDGLVSGLPVSPFPSLS